MAFCEIQAITDKMPMTTETEPRSGMKRFWQFIKSKRKDRTGVATLKAKAL